MADQPDTAMRAGTPEAPEPVIRHFSVEADGSFQLDTMLIAAEPDGTP